MEFPKIRLMTLHVSVCAWRWNWQFLLLATTLEAWTLPALVVASQTAGGGIGLLYAMLWHLEPPPHGFDPPSEWVPRG